MKKKFLIILIIQSVLILVALTYAFVQKGIADENRQLAEEKAIQATRQAKLAIELKMKLENCR